MPQITIQLAWLQQLESLAAGFFFFFFTSTSQLLLPLLPASSPLSSIDSHARGAERASGTPESATV